MAYALISVSDKTNLLPFAQALLQAGYELLSTGGTASFLREAALKVIDVGELTGFEELFDGRVKTLHPKVHGGILFDRNIKLHVEQRKSHAIPAIDFVVINLYPFSSKVSANTPLKEAIAWIDIGGPAMLRAAAKNHAHCLPVCDFEDYPRVIQALKLGRIEPDFRRELAAKVFTHTSRYDGLIRDYLLQPEARGEETALPFRVQSSSKLRYGENPHQNAELLTFEGSRGVPAAQILGGKELSYNNYLDLDAGYRLIQDFGAEPAVAIIKHNNACGAASKAGAGFGELFEAALACDPSSAFGGIIVTNLPVAISDVARLDALFFECLLCPAISAEVLERLSQKKNRRIMTNPDLEMSEGRSDKLQLSEKPREIRSIVGGLLAQANDDLVYRAKHEDAVTQRKPSQEQLQDLTFAMTIAKHLRSNAIVIAKGGKTLGLGAGQTSRIDALHCAVRKAKDQGFELKGAVLASDGFFPFADSVTLAADVGIAAVIQPGGSVRDPDSIAAADERGLSMVFSKLRHFRH